jgi:hypothetical protein
MKLSSPDTEPIRLQFKSHYGHLLHHELDQWKLGVDFLSQCFGADSEPAEFSGPVTVRSLEWLLLRDLRIAISEFRQS